MKINILSRSTTGQAGNYKIWELDWSEMFSPKEFIKRQRLRIFDKAALMDTKSCFASFVVVFTFIFLCG